MNNKKLGLSCHLICYHSAVYKINPAADCSRINYFKLLAISIVECRRNVSTYFRTICDGILIRINTNPTTLAQPLAPYPVHQTTHSVYGVHLFSLSVHQIPDSVYETVFLNGPVHQTAHSVYGVTLLHYPVHQTTYSVYGVLLHDKAPYTKQHQNKPPFPGRSNHNLYRRTQNHRFGVRRIQTGPNTAGTKRAEQPPGCAASPALSGRPAYLPTAVTSQTNSPTAPPHITSGRHTITLSPTPTLTPTNIIYKTTYRHPRIPSKPQPPSKKSKCRVKSPVSKVPRQISGLKLHGTTQKQGYNAKLARAVSHSS